MRPLTWHIWESSYRDIVTGDSLLGKANLGVRLDLFNFLPTATRYSELFLSQDTRCQFNAESVPTAEATNNGDMQSDDVIDGTVCSLAKWQHVRSNQWHMINGTWRNCNRSGWLQYSPVHYSAETAWQAKRSLSYNSRNEHTFKLLPRWRFLSSNTELILLVMRLRTWNDGVKRHHAEMRMIYAVSFKTCQRHSSCRPNTVDLLCVSCTLNRAVL